MSLKRSFLVASVLFTALQAQLVSAQSEAVCGSLDNGYGPYDYRTDTDKVNIVERHHFTPEVESLTRGKSTIVIGADIAYTLNAFPNHHRALLAMSKLARKEKTERPNGSGHSMGCWFERAERFRPDDAMVKVIHGLYLVQSGAAQEAVAKLEQARELDSNNANVHYNLGLAYFDLKKYELSLESAHVAYAQGFPLMGLRDKLKRAWKWRDPVAGRAEPAAPEPPSAPAELVPEKGSTHQSTPEPATGS